VRIIVVLDSCTDGTAVAAMRHLDDHDEMMAESVGNVGAARRAGLADALRLADELTSAMYGSQRRTPTRSSAATGWRDNCGGERGDSTASPARFASTPGASTRRHATSL